MRFPGTWLYAPGDRPDIVVKALNAGAAAVVVDLQDAVAPERKSDARARVLELIDRAAPAATQLHIRINEVTTAEGEADVEALGACSRLDRVAMIRAPRVESPQDVHTIRAALGESAPRVHVLLETAAAVENVVSIIDAPGVAAVSLGEGDLATELGTSDEEGLAWVRSRVVVAAAAVGLPPPSMSVYADLSDSEGLRDSCERGKRLGMLGRSAIHPAQLPVIARAFAPSAKDVAKAEAIVAAAQDHSGGFRMGDGQFVDRPVVLAARQTLDWYSHFSSTSKDAS